MGLLDGRDYATPADVEHLFVPVVVHRMLFTAGFLAEARETRWEEAMASLRDRCLELAPRPATTSTSRSP